MGLKCHENSSQLHILLLWSVNSSGDEILLCISAGRSNFCIKSSNGVALAYVEGARVIHGSGVLRPCSRKQEDYIGLSSGKSWDWSSGVTGQASKLLLLA